MREIDVRCTNGRQKWAGSAMFGIPKSLAVTKSSHGQVHGGPRIARWCEDRVRAQTVGVGANQVAGAGQIDLARREPDRS